VNQKCCNKKEQTDRWHQNSQPSTQINKEFAGQSHGEYGFRKIGKVAGRKFASGLVDYIRSHCITSSLRAVKLADNSSAPVQLESKAAILFILHARFLRLFRSSALPLLRSTLYALRSFAPRALAVTPIAAAEERAAKAGWVETGGLFPVNFFVRADGMKEQRFGGKVIAGGNAALFTDLEQEAERAGESRGAQAGELSGERFAFTVSVGILAQQADLLIDQMLEMTVLLGLVQEFRGEACAIDFAGPLVKLGGTHGA